MTNTTKETTKSDVSKVTNPSAITTTRIEELRNQIQANKNNHEKKQQQMEQEQKKLASDMSDLLASMEELSEHQTKQEARMDNMNYKLNQIWKCVEQMNNVMRKQPNTKAITPIRELMKENQSQSSIESIGYSSESSMSEEDYDREDEQSEDKMLGIGSKEDPIRQE